MPLSDTPFIQSPSMHHPIVIHSSCILYLFLIYSAFIPPHSLLTPLFIIPFVRCWFYHHSSLIHHPSNWPPYPSIHISLFSSHHHTFSPIITCCNHHSISILPGLTIACLTWFSFFFSLILSDNTDNSLLQSIQSYPHSSTFTAIDPCGAGLILAVFILPPNHQSAYPSLTPCIDPCLIPP